MAISFAQAKHSFQAVHMKKKISSVLNFMAFELNLQADSISKPFHLYQTRRVLECI
jgi:hypothetical protein